MNEHDRYLLPIEGELTDEDLQRVIGGLSVMATVGSGASLSNGTGISLGGGGVGAPKPISPVGPVVIDPNAAQKL